MFNGDWQNADYDKHVPGKVGFFLMPPATEGGTHGAMSAPLTYGIAANAKHADCAAFFLNWVATDPTARQIDVDRGRLEPGRPDRPGDARASPQGSVTNDTLAAGPVVSPGQWRDGLHRQRDRVRSSPRAGRPSSRRWSAASRRPTACSRPCRPSTRRNWRSDRSRRSAGWLTRRLRDRTGGRSLPRSPRSLRASRWRGVRRARWAGWLFVLPALVMYAAFVLVPLALTVQYSTLRWNGIGPQRFVGLNNYVTVLTDPDLVGIILNAFKLVVFFSFIPVALGLLVASVIRRVATGPLGATARTVLFLPQVIPLVAAGIVWSWMLSTTGLVNQVLSRDRPRRHHPLVARRLRAGAAGGRRHRRLGAARAVHRPAAHGHEQDRRRRSTSRRASTGRPRGRSSGRSRSRACATRSASASP